jgi:hypothetical protein
MESCRRKAEDGSSCIGKCIGQIESGVPVSLPACAFHQGADTDRPPFASQASAMSQSSSTTYSTNTSSMSSASATTVTSPGTSKGSWGEMMTSPPLPLTHAARPLPIPDKQAGNLDPVSLLRLRSN